MPSQIEPPDRESAYRTLVSTETLASHLDDPDWAIVDCRFELSRPARGREDYLRAHIPGALYADLDRDLAAPVEPGRTGRHPLPDAAILAARFSAWGIDARVQVVVYDDAGGMVAGRLWWMLRWLGHGTVALLDGDWRAWLREGRPVASGEESRPPRIFVPRLQEGLTADSAEVAAAVESGGFALLDARAPDRFRGQNETIDPKAGHIPGAHSAHYAANLDAQGYWRSAADLRARYDALLDGRDPAQVVAYCGSGVSACHTLLALEIAGLPGARLYPGSWSEWITDPARAIATDEVA